MPAATHEAASYNIYSIISYLSKHFQNAGEAEHDGCAAFTGAEE